MSRAAAAARLGLGGAPGEEGGLGALDLRHEGADGVHLPLADPLPDASAGGLGALVPLQLEHLAQPGEPGRGQALQVPHPHLLAGVVPGERAQAGEVLADLGGGGLVGREIARLAGDQVAALPRLGVLDGRHRPFELGQDPMGVSHPAFVLDEPQRRAVGDGAVDDQPQEQDREGDDELSFAEPAHPVADHTMSARQTGSVTTTSSPPSGRLRAVMPPPCSSAMRRAMGSPRPVPVSWVEK